MKKFRFALHSVTTVRAMRELQAREQFSLAIQACAEAERAQALVEARIHDINDLLQSLRSISFRGQEQASMLQTLQVEKGNLITARAKVLSTHRTREERRQEWLVTRRDLRLMDKLEEKALTRHKHEAAREEQALLDDVTSARLALTR